MARFTYQRSEWPLFTWDESVLMPLLAEVSHQEGRMLGEAKILGLNL